MMTEKITIKNKKGGIDILGGAVDSSLILDGEPIQFTFVRTISTTMRYKIGKVLNQDDIVAEKKFKGFVKYGYLGDDSLYSQFLHLINMLSNGEYLLELIEISSRNFFWEIGKMKNGIHTDFHYNNNCFYEKDDKYELDILVTQYSLNDEIIKDYIKIIGEGVKPICIFLKQEESNDAYILDGHHKYMAYNRLGKKVKGLLITKQKPTKINDSQGMKILKCFENKDKDLEKYFLRRG